MLGELQEIIDEPEAKRIRDEEARRVAAEKAEQRKKDAETAQARKEAEKAERLRRLGAVKGEAPSPSPSGVTIAVSPSHLQAHQPLVPLPPPAFRAGYRAAVGGNYSDEDEGNVSEEEEDVVSTLPPLDPEAAKIESWARKFLTEAVRKDAEAEITRYKNTIERINIPDVIVNNKIAIAMAITALEKRLQHNYMVLELQKVLEMV